MSTRCSVPFLISSLDSLDGYFWALPQYFRVWIFVFLTWHLRVLRYSLFDSPFIVQTQELLFRVLSFEIRIQKFHMSMCSVWRSECSISDDNQGEIFVENSRFQRLFIYKRSYALALTSNDYYRALSIEIRQSSVEEQLFENFIAAFYGFCLRDHFWRRLSWGVVHTLRNHRRPTGRLGGSPRMIKFDYKRGAGGRLVDDRVIKNPRIFRRCNI